MPSVSFTDALLLTLLDPPPQNPAPPTLLDMAQQYKTDDSYVGDFLEFVKSNTTKDHLDFMEDTQQGSPAWEKARIGRVTSSIAGEVLHLRDGTSCIAKILGTMGKIHSPAIDHGNHYESVARAVYRAREEKGHKNLNVVERGLFVDIYLPCLAASPDGVVNCSCHDKRVLEIKCPFKFKDIAPQEIPLHDNNYHLEIIDTKITLKKTSPWYYQVQFQMGVMGVLTCDFVVHTMKDTAVFSVPFDVKVWQLLKAKAVATFKEKVVPSLLLIC